MPASLLWTGYRQLTTSGCLAVPSRSRASLDSDANNLLVFKSLELHATVIDCKCNVVDSQAPHGAINDARLTMKAYVQPAHWSHLIIEGCMEGILLATGDLSGDDAEAESAHSRNPARYIPTRFRIDPGKPDLHDYENVLTKLTDSRTTRVVWAQYPDSQYPTMVAP